MNNLEERKANYQATIERHLKTIQQLSVAVEQLRGATALCDELLKEEPKTETPANKE